MAKNANKNGAGFALQFIGSLFFLATVTVLYGTGVNPLWGVWGYILYAVGAVGAVSLFFTSFAQLGSVGGAMAAKMAMSTATFTAIALVALTATGGNTTWFVAVLIGFVLAFLGSAMSMMDMKM